MCQYFIIILRVIFVWFLLPRRSAGNQRAVDKSSNVSIKQRGDDARLMPMPVLDAIMKSIKMPHERINSLERWDKVYIIIQLANVAYDFGYTGNLILKR